jgi:uncharacterized protein YecE (DUF72 family)
VTPAKPGPGGSTARNRVSTDAATVRVGVAGWDYRDWWGLVYPLRRPRGFDPLAYLARYFDTIEINSTFYRPPAPKAAAAWAMRVGANARFKFTAKLWQRFTHERDTPWAQADVDLVTAGLAPLDEAGRLGCLLAQFPWSFKRTAANEEWLGDVLTAFARFPLGVEVRHSSWSDPSFYAALAERDVAIVNIDQPVFHDSIKPGAAVTAEVGYVRLHGRNYENWFRDGAASHERYDYLYSADELKGWLDRIHEVAEHTRETYVITNNHFRGQAATNAAMLRKLAGEDVVVVPPELLQAYASVLAPLGIASRG